MKTRYCLLFSRYNVSKFHHFKNILELNLGTNICLLLHCKIASKIIMFQVALKFRVAIVFYYNRQTTMRVVKQMRPPLTWHISQIIIDCLSPIVIAYVLNQSLGH
jgi:SNF family Na+-dependent transporter